MAATVAVALLAKNTCTWKCMLGNLKKWKEDEILNYTIEQKSAPVTVDASLVSRSEMLVNFSWNHPVATFAEILEALGKIPLPPYMDPEVQAEDVERYQTVYSKTQGAVAAPTAGLHFTDEVLRDLLKKICTLRVSIHIKLDLKICIYLQF